MIEDFRQFLKIYRMYKKGKHTMDKVKEFVNEHKKELMYAAGIIMIYSLGFRRGVKTSERAIVHFCNEAAKATGVSK